MKLLSSTLIDILFRRQIQRRAQAHIAALLERYSENRRCLRAGIAAYSNVDIAKLGEVPTLERQHIRFVRAYAKEIQAIRNGGKDDVAE